MCWIRGIRSIYRAYIAKREIKKKIDELNSYASESASASAPMDMTPSLDLAKRRWQGQSFYNENLLKEYHSFEKHILRNLDRKVLYLYKKIDGGLFLKTYKFSATHFHKKRCTDDPLEDPLPFIANRLRLAFGQKMIYTPVHMPSFLAEIKTMIPDSIFSSYKETTYCDPITALGILIVECEMILVILFEYIFLTT
jgi:hypothetical protein